MVSNCDSKPDNQYYGPKLKAYIYLLKVINRNSSVMVTLLGKGSLHLNVLACTSNRLPTNPYAKKICVFRLKWAFILKLLITVQQCHMVPRKYEQVMSKSTTDVGCFVRQGQTK